MLEDQDLEKIQGMIDASQEKLAGMLGREFLKIHDGFDEIDHRFDRIDKRFDVIDRRFDAVDKRFGDGGFADHTGSVRGSATTYRTIGGGCFCLMTWRNTR